MPENPMVRMQELLRELFQFDCQDLDFGIYRVLNYRRKQIEEFIGTRLPQVVDEAFAQYAAADKAAVERELEEKRHEIVASLGASAFDATGQLVMAFRETPLGKVYIELEQKAKVGQVAEELKAGVYNDLYTFFSRYYEDGDVFSKPRRGKVEIPFTGHEDVVLHWANKDQYYIKTGEQFKSYRFTVDKQAVQFALRNAATEHNNNQREKRYFVLAEESPVAHDDKARTLTVFFEYRPLTNTEKKIYGKTENQKPQDKLNAVAEEAVLKRVKDATLKGRLAQSVGEGKPGLLRYHLNRFAKKNSTDFFIHKNLRGFLERELDDFLKTEVLRVDELLATGGTVAAQQIARGRVVREIAGKIIEFLAQVEDFQKKLFEKRKFVVRTEYCVTLDRLPEAMWDEVLKNEAQLAEWRELYAITKKKLDKAFLKEHDKLVVDTRHFPEDFKWRLLASFDDLDAALDGLLIKSENFQALALLLAKYRDSVDTTYIDPPYNTGSDEFVYRDNYRHSCWATMLASRIPLAFPLMKESGLFFMSIDDNEFSTAQRLLDSGFVAQNWLANLIWNRGHSAQAGVFMKYHEYVMAYARDASQVNLSRTGEGEIDAGAMKKPSKRHAVQEFTFPPGVRVDAPDGTEFKKRWGGTEWVELVSGRMIVRKGKLANEVTLRAAWTQKNQMEQYFRGKRPVFDSKKQEVVEFYFTSSGKLKVIKRREAVSLPSTLPDYGSAGANTSALVDVVGHEVPFTPKPVRLIMDLTRWFSSDKGVLLDFFGGSGTSAHSIINLNRSTGARRKYVLIEMAAHFDNLLIPRIKKVVFSESWKEGKPVGGKGVSHFLKYHLLEQYEDTLNNLAFPRAKEGELALKQYGDEYLLRYMLDFETAGSASLLAVEQLRHPFDYRLKVQEGDEIVERPVDLVETFNYLLGLQVRKVREFQNPHPDPLPKGEGKRRYRVTMGEARNGKSVVVVWRDTDGLESSKEALQRDRQFVEREILPALLGKDAQPDRLLVNQPYAGEAEAIEPEFKRLMFAPIG
ncbi:MAG: site-specific DNA-methyltransferase [Verrucomicrobia bacterium]|nr:site-specific DNA-methyltransferase [Verrucomicrobiota bacterium]